MQTWSRFRRLTATERHTVLTATAALVATRIALRVFGYRLWKSILQVTFPSLISSEISMAATAQSVARFEAAANYHLRWGGNCLERSLVLWWMLRRRAIPADLRLGAQKAGGAFEAHAWVELNGTVLNDPAGNHRNFVRFGIPDPIEVELR